MDYNFKDYDIGEIRFKYIPSDGYIWHYTDWEAKIGSGSYSKEINGLTENTEYIFIAELKYEMGKINGDEKSFITNG